jgi:hypothetical protein
MLTMASGANGSWGRASPQSAAPTVRAEPGSTAAGEDAEMRDWILEGGGVGMRTETQNQEEEAAQGEGRPWAQRGTGRGVLGVPQLSPTWPG